MDFLEKKMLVTINTTPSVYTIRQYETLLTTYF